MGQVDSPVAVVPPTEPSSGEALEEGCDETQSPRARSEEETNACIAQSQWDDPVVEVTPMDKMEVIRTLSDYDNWIDVEVKGV